MLLFPANLHKWGPLVSITRRMNLISYPRYGYSASCRRIRTRFEHDARFEKLTLLTACHNTTRARNLLGAASAASREALFTLLTVRRKDFFASDDG